MKMMVVIPMKPYRALLGRCELVTCPEYFMLKNGIIVRSQEGGEEVHIPCEPDGAKAIYDFAAGICPEAVPYLKTTDLPQ